MAAILTDAQIQSLLSCRKAITLADIFRLQRDPKRPEVPQTFLVNSGRRQFRILASRPNANKPNKFSILLQVSRRGEWFNLIRCNGHHAPHTNSIERETIPANTFHIHQATERYQRCGREPEAFATQTDKFDGPKSAIEYLCNNYGFIVTDQQSRLHPLWDQK